MAAWDDKSTTVQEDRTALLTSMGLYPRWVLRPQPAKSPIEHSGRIDRTKWQRLEQHAKSCCACALHQDRTQVVFGEGDLQARWLFLGEGPGRNEDLQGRPFVGRAGLLLTKMIAALQLNRTENVYITNVVKCRPPNNRPPDEQEVKACSFFLYRQIQWLAPRIIVALGRSATVAILQQSHCSLSEMRGRVHRYQHIPVVVTYHPAYLLRQPKEKAKAWQDLLFAQYVYQSAEIG